MAADETYLCDLLLAGDLAGLQGAALRVEGFPQGRDNPGHAGSWPDPGRHEILRRLIAAGAPLQARGMNDWTALHLAGLRGDLVALEILLAAGADRRARTCIDGYATPEQEARASGQAAAADLLRDGRSPLLKKWER